MMFRRLLLATLVVASLVSMVQGTQAAGQPRRSRIITYLFGGYGPGPFGKGQVTYAGHPPIYNYTKRGHQVR
jgi:hypothetical protein